NRRPHHAGGDLFIRAFSIQKIFAPESTTLEWIKIEHSDNIAGLTLQSGRPAGYIGSNGTGGAPC
ncbi:hypothetical protein, partial [Oscillibacter ruminantium]|uniref:hypothetical protein n=1 Tax=Oscillibacter ruminantium TaxID=1263547 RepID=UPI00331DA20B